MMRLIGSRLCLAGSEDIDGDGWELVTYDYMATSSQIKGAFIVTFRKAV